jgi:hypothetical protein
LLKRSTVEGHTAHTLAQDALKPPLRNASSKALGLRRFARQMGMLVRAAGDHAFARNPSQDCRTLDALDPPATAHITRMTALTELSLKLPSPRPPEQSAAPLKVLHALATLPHLRRLSIGCWPSAAAVDLFKVWQRRSSLVHLQTGLFGNGLARSVAEA